MKTFRSTALFISAVSAVLILTGCGGGAAPAASGAPVKSTAPAVAGHVQPLTEWLPASTSVLRDLSADLSSITSAMTGGGTPDPSDITADATKGLDITAPDGYPDLDRAWDAVMNDYLVVSGDLSSGDSAKTSADLDTANADMVVLQNESSKL